MNTTTDSIETISNLEELERAERAQAELAARVAAARQAIEDGEQKERELVQRKRWRELEAQMQAEVEIFHAAREKAAAALVEHIDVMYAAEQKWIGLYKQRYGVSSYASNRIPVRQLLPYGQPVDLALALLLEAKQGSPIPRSDWW